MNMNKNQQLLCTAALLCCSSVAQSAIVHLSGTTVDFYYDDAQPGMAAYGALTAVGDSIFATPTGFQAEGLNGSSDSFNAFGTVTVVAKAGFAFKTIAVQQEGDYQLNGANASVSVTNVLTVEDSTNAMTNDLINMSVSSLTTNDNMVHAWSSLGAFDMSTPTWNSVNSIDLSLDSTLTAVTLLNGEYALIGSKFVGGGMLTIETTVVPVPASVWLFVSGLLLLSGLIRRSR